MRKSRCCENKEEEMKKRKHLDLFVLEMYPGKTGAIYLKKVSKKNNYLVKVFDCNGTHMFELL